MKVFANKERANWILDEIHHDFVRHTRHDMVSNDPDAYFVINPWGLGDIRSGFRHSKILTFLHHIDTLKIAEYRFDELNMSDMIVVPNRFTYAECIKHIPKEKVKQIGYWVLDKRRGSSQGAQVLKKKLSIDGETLIGSFQKDSEGQTEKPKLSKGPDIFIDVVSRINRERKVKVILTGYNRGYVIAKLKERGIPFEFFHRHEDLNTLYDCLDAYLVTSRIEGGPQAVLEASVRRVPILSTNVGMASDVLHPDCICEDADELLVKFLSNTHLSRIDENEAKVKDFYAEKVVPKFDDCLEKICS